MTPQQRWRQKNKQRILAYQRHYFKTHPEQRQKRQHAGAKWARANPKRVLILQRRYRHKNPDLCRKRVREAAWKAKEKVIHHFGGKCALCGAKDVRVLGLHHLNGGGGRHRQKIKRPHGGVSFYRWLIQHHFKSPPLLVLCANCHILSHCAR